MPYAPVKLATDASKTAADALYPKVFVGATVPEGAVIKPGDLHINGTTIKILNNASTPAWVTITVS